MLLIIEFCKKRKITKKIRDAFTAYCRGSISEDYQIGNGETVTGILMGFTEEELEKMWLDFTIELKRFLEKDDLSSQNN